MGCQKCGGPLRLPVREHNKGDTGIRLSSHVWLAHLEVDPFCSADCCREWHGIQDAKPTCADCGTELSSNRNSLSGERCEPCGERARKARKFSTPGRCAGCDGDMACVTDGCGHCTERARKRERRRTDPAFKARENDRSRASRARRNALVGRTAGSIEPPENGSPHGEGRFELSTREAAQAAEEEKAA